MTEEQSVVLVTGASGGIGAATARLLLDRGHHVVAHHSRRREAVDALVSHAESVGRRCWPVQADLGEMSGVQRLVSEVDRLLVEHPSLRLTGLVNNAARLLGPSFDAADPDDFDLYLAINARAPFFLTQQLSRRMTTGGSIVNVSSAGVHFSSPGDIVYAMSKATVEALTRHAAEALAPRGIRINAVVPGFTDNGHPAFQDPTIRSYMAGFSVLDDVASVEDVARAIGFLLSDDSRRTTGTLIDVSGGSTLGARPRTAGKVSLRSVAEGDALPAPTTGAAAEGTDDL